jgi:hypothetical protein
MNRFSAAPAGTRSSRRNDGKIQGSDDVRLVVQFDHPPDAGDFRQQR